MVDIARGLRKIIGIFPAARYNSPLPRTLLPWAAASGHGAKHPSLPKTPMGTNFSERKFPVVKILAQAFQETRFLEQTFRVMKRRVMKFPVQRFRVTKIPTLKFREQKIQAQDFPVPAVTFPASKIQAVKSLAETFQVPAASFRSTRIRAANLAMTRTTMKTLAP